MRTNVGSGLRKSLDGCQDFLNRHGGFPGEFGSELIAVQQLVDWGLAIGAL
jgi:hypothetical protein